MMKDLYIEANEDTLAIECKQGHISMKGNSILADPMKFFKPVKEWVLAYLQNPEPKTIIDLRFDYVDTASVQSVFDTLKLFIKMPDYQERLIVNWYFEFDDPELLEVGEIMEARLRLKFNLIEYKVEGDDGEIPDTGKD